MAGLDQMRMHHMAAVQPNCDRVREMLLSRLDPVMLIGFLCKNKEDWIDLRQRVTEVCALFFIHTPGLDGGVGYSRSMIF